MLTQTICCAFVKTLFPKLDLKKEITKNFTSMSEKKQKSDKKYVYDYPDQREFCKDLQTGDITALAEWTGNTPGHISRIVNGTRKMPELIKLYIEKIYEHQRNLHRDIKEIQNTIAE